MATKIIKAWVNGGVQNIEVEDIVSDPQPLGYDERLEALENKPVSTYATVTLMSDNWVGSSAPYSQTVTISGVTTNTQVDLRPTATQTAEMQDEDIAFVAENDNGVVTVYSINGKPTIDYEVQAVLTEVASV